ncbi:hypothetical protein OVS_03835 [Mycoplasma ovis str. Michigan]|uniref:Uncharacterized protein n=1 Tax=Mycoplasma ovis str. Michigan TaxID=1415773 RepID=A0ABN4BQ88_9MOLU|nr:hypothetical protein [Mycoplasma ovis]AHC40499.1 hypothetical protein OVS_03835 [Mycoplasma ovis str. Michigan]
MSFLGLSKFAVFALSGVSIATPIAFSKSASNSYSVLAEFLPDKTCYEFEIESNTSERLMACTNNNYYLYDIEQNKILELKDLKA